MKGFFKFLVVIQWLLAPLPGLLMLGLYGLSVRAEMLIGKMPEPFKNDPGHIGENDGLYRGIYQCVDLLLAGMLFSMLFWLVAATALVFLSVWLWRKQRIRGWVISGWAAIAVYLIGFLILWLEPTKRLGWYFD